MNRHVSKSASRATVAVTDTVGRVAPAAVLHIGQAVPLGDQSQIRPEVGAARLLVAVLPPQIDVNHVVWKRHWRSTPLVPGKLQQSHPATQTDRLGTTRIGAAPETGRHCHAVNADAAACAHHHDRSRHTPPPIHAAVCRFPTN